MLRQCYYLLASGIYGVFDLPRLSGFEGGSAGYDRSDKVAAFDFLLDANSGQAPKNGFRFSCILFGVEHFRGWSLSITGPNFLSV